MNLFWSAISPGCEGPDPRIPKNAWVRPVDVQTHRPEEIAWGLAICGRMLGQGLPWAADQGMRAGRVAFQRSLDQLLAVRYVRLEVPIPRPGFHLFNPTLLAHGDGFLGIVRASNYELPSKLNPFRMREILNENLLVELGPGLELRSCRPLVEPDYPRNGFPIHGLEDCRLFHRADGIGVSATVRDATPMAGLSRIATCRLDLAEARLDRFQVLDHPAFQFNEKNWMPLLGREDWVHSVNADGWTYTVEAAAKPAGSCRLTRHHRVPVWTRGFRGGGQLVPFHGGWLGIVHEVAPGTYRPTYEHRFIHLDDALRLRRVSRAFAIREQRSVEFAAGLAIRAGKAFVGFGVRDCEAWLAELNLEDLEPLLETVPSS